MDEKLKKSFCQATYTPEHDLANKVWRKICIRNKRDSLIRLCGFSAIVIASVVGFVPAFKMLQADLTTSGFYDYFSLVFSSNGSIASYWKEFVLSLAESLPMMSIIMSLGLVLLFFISLRYAIKQITHSQLVFTKSNVLSY